MQRPVADPVDVSTADTGVTLLCVNVAWAE